ncbi:MAG: HAD domain-containing protein [Fusobacterium sp.]
MILFLDIDGVLNNTTYPRTVGTVKDFAEFREDWWEKYDTPYMCPDNIKTFVNFMKQIQFQKDKYEKIYCILSSTWRAGGEDIKEKLNYIFKDFGYDKGDIISGRTCKLNVFKNRGEEVQDFLNHLTKYDIISPIEHDAFNKNYIILDDDNDFLEEQQSHLFLCDGSTGFTQEIVDRINKWVNVK